MRRAGGSLQAWKKFCKSKVFYLRKSESVHIIRHPAQTRGAYASSRTLGGDAMDAGGFTRRVMRLADERSRVVPIPRRWDQARKLAMSAFGATRRASDGG
jgi:hypothetical protein